jgi:hypothetical protein
MVVTRHILKQFDDPTTIPIIDWLDLSMKIRIDIMIFENNVELINIKMSSKD